MHRPLSRQVWLTLKNLNLLAPRRGQRGRNHQRRLNDRPINVIIRGERQQNFQEKRRGANQSNLLNIPVDIFAPLRQPLMGPYIQKSIELILRNQK